LGGPQGAGRKKGPALEGGSEGKRLAKKPKVAAEKKRNTILGGCGT